jgi:hypothetical protein
MSQSTHLAESLLVGTDRKLFQQQPCRWEPTTCSTTLNGGQNFRIGRQRSIAGARPRQTVLSQRARDLHVHTPHRTALHNIALQTKMSSSL